MILGRTGFARKGEWIAAVTYDALDIVTHEGKVYIGRRESVGSEPSSESNDWVMLPGAPSFEIEETASGYDLTITGSDGTSETISILNGEVDREELEDALEAFRSSTDVYFASDYDDTATYSIGDSCIYEGRLYRCIEDIPTAEPWTAEHWEPVVLADKLTQMWKDAVVKADVVVNSAEPGDVVTIADGGNDLPVVDLSVSLLPVQDLHGQSSPYPPGGGKNKFPGASEIGGSSSRYGLTWTPQEDGGMKISGTVDIATWLYIDRYINIENFYGFSVGDTISISGKDTANDWNVGVHFLNGSTVLKTMSKNESAVIPEGTTRVRILFYAKGSAPGVVGETINNTVYMQIESGSTPTAWSPYSNVCPISGWTGVEVYQRGKNLLEPSLMKDQLGWNYIDIAVKPNTSYAVSANLPNDGVLILYAYNTAGWVSTSQVYAGKPVAVTTNEDGVIRIQQRRTADTKSFADYQIQVELGSTATAYEPYQGTTIPIDWPDSAGTVYGGSLDLTTGVLTVDKGIITFNGSETWYDYPSFEGYYVSLSTMKRGMRQDGASNMLKDSKSAAYGQTNSMWLGVDSRYFFAIGVYDSMGDTLLSFKEYLADHPLQIVYPLETPLVFQLDPVQISTLLGSNSFWSNGNGVVDLEYRCDTKLYIEQLTKPTEDDMIANSNIPANIYFNVGNVLYLSTAAIATGEKIEPDTNCTRKSLADALNDLHD